MNIRLARKLRESKKTEKTHHWHVFDLFSYKHNRDDNYLGVKRKMYVPPK